MERKLTKKNALIAAAALALLLVGADLTIVEESNIKAALQKAQSIVGNLLGDDEAETEEKAEEAPAKEESAE